MGRLRHPGHGGEGCGIGCLITWRIKEEDPSWEDMVPPEIAQVIKHRRFFGYREAELPDATHSK